MSLNYYPFHSINRIKTVGLRGIRTRIVGVEGKYADHLTNTTAPSMRELDPFINT